MILKEFRIPMPLSVEEYQVAQLYSVVQASRQNTNGDTGVEILANEPYTNDHGKGQYTHKVFHLGSKLPRAVSALLPESAKTMVEKAWNAYPYCRTEYSNAFLGERFTIIVESRHIADDGSSENDDLKIRKVHHLNIATDPAGSFVHDPSKFKSQVTGRGPLTSPEWAKTQKPVMCCYKLVTIKFHVFGFQTAVEHMIDQKQIALLLEFQRQVFCTIDEWFHLSMEDIRRMEADVQEELRARIRELGTASAVSPDTLSVGSGSLKMASS